MRVHLTAYREHDGVISLTMDAADIASARHEAEGLGYRILSARVPPRFWPQVWSRQPFSVSLLGQELLALLDAGMGIVEAVALLAARAKSPEAKRVLAQLHRSIGEGHPFSRAIEAIPGIFSPLFVATVRASERTSNLPEALRRYLSYDRQINGLRDRILAASIYPLLLIGVGALVILFLLAYVVPRFSKVYDDIGQAHLPVLSRLLMHWGRLAGDHAAVLGLALLFALIAVAYALTRPRTRAALERGLWNLPAVGEHLRIYQLARFTRTVAMLLKGGVPLVTVLDMTGDLLRQPALQAGREAARKAIWEGRMVSDALGAHGLATEIGVRLIAVGERSGELGEAMERVAGFYEADIARGVEWFSRLFEPMLMILIGLLIGGIVVLMYLPIFELASSIQ